MKELVITTHKKFEMREITREIYEVLRQEGAQNGLCTVFIPHTTAAITINENADPDVIRDINHKLNQLFPDKDNYWHSEGNSAAHIKTMLTGQSQTIIIEDGQLKLGTWQGIYLCEFDGPRSRKVWITIGEIK